MKKYNVLLGITSSIACYKACDLLNQLLKNKMQVKVVMTKNATNLVCPLTFQTLSNNIVYIDMFEKNNIKEIKHISLSDWSDFLIIAPATANIIGKIANGIADDLLSTTAMSLATEKPIIIAPAMNVNMWKNPLVKRNIELLQNTKIDVKGKLVNKYYIISPRKARLACEVYGVGALAKVDDIIKSIVDIMEKK